MVKTPAILKRLDPRNYKYASSSTPLEQRIETVQQPEPQKEEKIFRPVSYMGQNWMVAVANGIVYIGKEKDLFGNNAAEFDLNNSSPQVQGILNEHATFYGYPEIKKPEAETKAEEEPEITDADFVEINGSKVCIKNGMFYHIKDEEQKEFSLDKAATIYSKTIDKYLEQVPDETLKNQVEEIQRKHYSEIRKKAQEKPEDLTQKDLDKIKYYKQKFNSEGRVLEHLINPVEFPEDVRGIATDVNKLFAHVKQSETKEDKMLATAYLTDYIYEKDTILNAKEFKKLTEAIKTKYEEMPLSEPNSAKELRNYLRQIENRNPRNSTIYFFEKILGKTIPQKEKIWV